MKTPCPTCGYKCLGNCGSGNNRYQGKRWLLLLGRISA